MLFSLCLDMGRSQFCGKCWQCSTPGHLARDCLQSLATSLKLAVLNVCGQTHKGNKLADICNSICVPHYPSCLFCMSGEVGGEMSHDDRAHKQ